MSVKCNLCGKQRTNDPGGCRCAAGYSPYHHIIERLRHHAKDERNTAFARSTMREAEQELSRVTAQRGNVSDRLRASLDDPMWADHAEISKSLLRATLLEIDSLRAELAASRERESRMRESLDHIARVSMGGRTKSKRNEWIAQRAKSALNGDDYWMRLEKPHGYHRALEGAPVAALAEGAQG